MIVLIAAFHACLRWTFSVWEYWSHNPAVVAIVSVWLSRLWSHVEHRGTSKKVDEIHKQLSSNGNGRDHTTVIR